MLLTSEVLLCWLFRPVPNTGPSGVLIRGEFTAFEKHWNCMQGLPFLKNKPSLCYYQAN